MTQAVRQRQPNNPYQPTGQPAFRRRELITNDETVVMVAEDKLVNFLPLPRALLRSGIGGNAKLVYSLLLSRGTLSQRNGWADGDFRQVYVIYPVGELAEAMGRSTTTVKRALKELEEAGLIQRRANQTTRANRIYLFLPPDTTDLGEMDFPYAGSLPAKKPLALPDWNQDEGAVLPQKPAGRDAEENSHAWNPTEEGPQPEEPDWDEDETPTQPDLIFWDETLEEVLPEEPVWSKAKENDIPDSHAWNHTQETAQGETSAWGAAEENAIADLLAWSHAEENAQDEEPAEDLPTEENDAWWPTDADVPPENDTWWSTDADVPPENDAWWPSDADVPPEDAAWWPTDADVPPENDAWWPSDSDVPPENDSWWPSDEDAPPEHPVWCLDGVEVPAFFAPVSDLVKGQVCTPTGARLVCQGFTSGPPPVQI
jgi:hypothetical protein